MMTTLVSADLMALNSPKNPGQGVVEPSATDMLPIAMFERLLAFFDKGKAGKTDHTGAFPLQRAAAVLLAIAARLDGHMAPTERDSIVHLLRTRLGAEDAEGLVDDAYVEAVASTDFYQVTRVIKDGLAADQRADVIEMLWEIAYADGEVHDYEANLIRRVAGLLHVEDRDAGEARKRVIERRGPSVSPLPSKMDERRRG